MANSAYGEITWTWYPTPPEMLQASTERGPDYLYECIGTCDAGDDTPGDMVRVFVPMEHCSKNRRVIEELNEKHGRYAESRKEAQEFDGFVETFVTAPDS